MLAPYVPPNPPRLHEFDFRNKMPLRQPLGSARFPLQIGIQLMDTLTQFVRVSRRDSRYLELEDGQTFVPNGCNICWPGRNSDALAYGKHLLDQLADHGANFARLWLSSGGFDIETSAGVYDDAVIDRARQFIAHAKSRGIRVKMTFEHFRYILPEREKEHLLSSDVFARKIYHPTQGGPVETMQAYLDSEPGRRLFLNKLDLWAKYFADEPAVFGWELWNEMNCIHANGWVEWTRLMLGELKKRFPRHLVMQSLGSLDNDGQALDYAALSKVETQDIAQVHRYLDEGAPYPVCSGPVDASVAESLARMRGWYPAKPLLLAEAGAVEPRHAGPWRYYRADADGIILHDVLFGGFFAGGCGGGQNWHWDSYVDKNGLWPQFAGFARATARFDPAAHHAQVFAADDDSGRVRAHGLHGPSITAAWIRDARNDWRSEFEHGKKPEQVDGIQISLPTPAGPVEARCYNPWTDVWSAATIENGKVSLPSFKRSIVVYIDSTRPEVGGK